MDRRNKRCGNDCNLSMAADGVAKGAELLKSGKKMPEMQRDGNTEK